MNRPILLFCTTLLAAALLAQEPPAPRTPPASPAQPTTPSQDPAPPPTPTVRTAKELGLHFAIWSSKLRRSIIRTRTPYGFSVRKVDADSPAAKAGLTRGMVVMQVDGKPLREARQLDAMLQEAKAGQTLRLRCVRRKARARLTDRSPWETIDIEIVLPPAAQPAPKPADPKVEGEGKQTRQG